MKLRVYYWNPNGTNDIEVLNDHNEVIDSLPEALFGVNIDSESIDIKVTGRSLKKVVSRIAVSPVSDGQDVESFLNKYFKEAA